MKRKMKAMLAGFLCLACLPAPLSASAKITNVQEYEDSYHRFQDPDSIFYKHIYSFEADLFSYKNEGHYIGNDPSADVYYLDGSLQTDVTRANTVVTGVFYKEGEDKPLYYTLNPLINLENENASPAEFSTNARASELEAYTGGETLEVGDLLFISTHMNIKPTNIPELCFHQENGLEVEIEYLGHGVDVLGEDFRKVMYFELFTEPRCLYSDVNYETREVKDLVNKGCFDLGNVDNDDDIDLVDVITVNQYLMVGNPMGFYAEVCADVNNDGQVTSGDALHILRKVVGLIDSFEEVQN